MTKGNKIVLVTFGLFMTEAILHYNLGKKANVDINLPTIKSGFLPPTKSLLRIGGIVLVFSLINSYAINKIS